MSLQRVLRFGDVWYETIVALILLFIICNLLIVNISHPLENLIPFWDVLIIRSVLEWMTAFARNSLLKHAPQSLDNYPNNNIILVIGEVDEFVPGDFDTAIFYC